jgi:hypothetical protein
MKTKVIKPNAPRKSQKYIFVVAVATLDCMPKQCCGIGIDGEETQEQKVFRVVFKAL